MADVRVRVSADPADAGAPYRALRRELATARAHEHVSWRHSLLMVRHGDRVLRRTLLFGGPRDAEEIEDVRAVADDLLNFNHGLLQQLRDLRVYLATETAVATGIAVVLNRLVRPPHDGIVAVVAGVVVLFSAVLTAVVARWLSEAERLEKTLDAVIAHCARLPPNAPAPSAGKGPADVIESDSANARREREL